MVTAIQSFEEITDTGFISVTHRQGLPSRFKSLNFFCAHFELVNKRKMNKFEMLSCRETFLLLAPHVSMATLILQVPTIRGW